MEKFLNKIWYNKLNLFSVVLSPFSLIFYFVITVRRALYKLKILKIYKFSTPVIIIGNLTVGGSGKTPLTIWLCNYLSKKGLKVGVISSGYKSTAKKPKVIEENITIPNLGDEAVLIYQKTKVPVVTGGNRIDAMGVMERKFKLDVIIHDDGLQHYALYRDLEILVIDKIRKFGNKLLLPAGPLRETQKRLLSTDIVVKNNSKNQNIPAIDTSNDIINTKTLEITTLDSHTNSTIHLVTGIGSIENIKHELDRFNVNYILHTYPDHYEYNGSEIDFNDDYSVFTTEKDFVKLNMYNKKLYILRLNIEPNTKFIKKFDEYLIRVIKNEN